MALFTHEQLKTTARQNRRTVTIYLGGGDAYVERGVRTEGPATVVVRPTGRGIVKRISYRNVGNVGSSLIPADFGVRLAELARQTQ